MKTYIPVRGNIKRSGNLQFLVATSKANEIQSGELGKYLQANKRLVHAKKLAKNLGLSDEQAQKGLLLWDIETTGVTHSDPVIMISMASIRNGLKLETWFARDYSEESAMLAKFPEVLNEYGACYTYNGLSFDCPRITARAMNNCIRLNGLDANSLTRILGKKHIDLYPLFRKELGDALPPRDRSLQTLEKILFGFSRKYDLPGEEIGEVYEEYVRGERAGKTKIRRLFKHGTLDILALTAALVYAAEWAQQGKLLFPTIYPYHKRSPSG